MKFLKSMVCASIVIALSACGDNETAQTYISKAESLIAEKQNNTAIISLKNAIKIDAKNAKARFLLGQLYLNDGDAENAAKELNRANQLKFNIDKVLPLLARAYMLMEYDEDILSLAEQEKLLSTPSTQYLAYKTMAAIRTNDKALAQATVDEALAFSASDSYSMLASAYLAFSDQNLPHAGTLATRILTATPNNVDTLMLQGQIAIAEQNFALAVESFKQYFQLQPNSGKVQLFIADALLKNGQLEEAEEIADAILAKIPTQPFLQYIKAVTRFENKDYKTASEYANQSLNSGFNTFRLKLVAGASAFYLQNYEQSHFHLKDIVEYLAVDNPARRMLAISQLQLGLIDDISETLTGYDPSSKDNAQFLSTLSYELLEVGAIDEAQKLAEQAASANDMTAEQTARSGILKLMMNDPSGVETLELALQQSPELESAELALAFASIKLGDLPRASKIADKWLKEYPGKANGYNLQASIFFKQNELEQGKAALAKSLEVEPNNVFALTQMVQLARHQKDIEQATLLTEQALKAHPNNIEVLGQYLALHQGEEGLNVITQAQERNADDIQYGILLSEALMRVEKFKQASAVLDGYELTAKTPKRYWQLLLASNMRQVEGKDTFLILEKWRKTNIYHIEPILLLADYWVKKRSPDRALSLLQDAFKIHPQNLILHLVKMQVLLDNRRVDEAKSFFATLEQFDLNKGLRAGIEGRILLLEKKFAIAIPKLQQFYQIKPSGNNANHLAFALEGNNQKSEAIALLEQHIAKEALDDNVNPNVSLHLANLYLAENTDKAISEYERLITVSPNNVVVLNNLSWLYMDKGEFTQALKYAEQAYSITSEVPNVVDTYAQVLLKSGNKVEALTKAKEAHELAKGEDIDIALNLAEALLANNNNEEAQLILAKVTAITPAQKEKKQALLK